MKFTAMRFAMSDDIAAMLSGYCRNGSADGEQVPLALPNVRLNHRDDPEHFPSPTTDERTGADEFA